MDGFFLLWSLRLHSILFVQSIRISCRFVVVRFLLHGPHVGGHTNFVSVSYRVFASYPVLRCTCSVWSTPWTVSFHTCTCNCTFLVLFHLLRCFVFFLVRWTGGRRTRISLPRTHDPRGGAFGGVGNPIDTFSAFQSLSHPGVLCDRRGEGHPRTVCYDPMPPPSPKGGEGGRSTPRNTRRYMSQIYAIQRDYDRSQRQKGISPDEESPGGTQTQTYLGNTNFATPSGMDRYLDLERHEKLNRKRSRHVPQHAPNRGPG